MVYLSGREPTPCRTARRRARARRRPALAADPPAPTEKTPDGAATLLPVYTGASTAEGRAPQVLVGWRVTVGAGSQAATVRPRVTPDGGGWVVGDPVALPAEPGTYAFAAPHVRWDGRGNTFGLDADTGGLAIVVRQACTPQYGQYGDICQVLHLERYAYGMTGERLGNDGGASLSIATQVEPDADGDLLGDTTEDRHDLGMTVVPTRRADGDLDLAVTVVNRSGTQAGIPSLVGDATTRGVAQDPACVATPLGLAIRVEGCRLAPFAPGEQRVQRLTVRTKAPTVTLRLQSEGVELAPADNTLTVPVPPVPRPSVALARGQRAGEPVAVRVTAVRAGTMAVRLDTAFVRLTGRLRFTAAGTRTLHLRPTAAQARRLRAAAPVSAQVSVRRLGTPGVVSSAGRLR